jgi:hypothetical protein
VLKLACAFCAAAAAAAAAAVYGEVDADALMPVMSHQFMLQERHREQLYRETGVC